MKKYFTLIILCGCAEINPPKLPPIDTETFSYEEILQKQKTLQEEIKEKLDLNQLN